MKSDSNIKQAIVDQAKQAGYQLDERGYSKEPLDNTVSASRNHWDIIKQDLEQGDGNELSSDREGYKPNFSAAYSSSALCVNTFAPMRVHPNAYKLFGLGGISEAQFEKKVPTGLRGNAPNLDFFFETSQYLVGVESKFTEVLHITNSSKLLEKYDGADALDYLSGGYRELISYYTQHNSRGYLNVAQLLKHGMGLFRLSQEIQKKPLLVFVYHNLQQYSNEEGVMEILENEINDFEERINKCADLEFKAYTYTQIWDEIQEHPLLHEHVMELRTKYGV